MSLRRLTSASIATLALALTGAGDRRRAGPGRTRLRPGPRGPARGREPGLHRGHADAAARHPHRPDDPHSSGAAGTATLTVTGTAGVPSTGVSAVVLNLTGDRPDARRPTSRSTRPARRLPNSSNLNLRGRTRANQVIAQVGANGAITIYNYGGNTDVVVDITGYFATGSSYNAEAPAADPRHPFAVGAAGRRTAPGWCRSPATAACRPA